MALITCPECGKQVSTRASACPHCGYPISTIMNNPEDRSESLRAGAVDNQRKAVRGNDAGNREVTVKEVVSTGHTRNASAEGNNSSNIMIFLGAIVGLVIVAALSNCSSNSPSAYTDNGGYGNGQLSEEDALEKELSHYSYDDFGHLEDDRDY